VHLLIQRDSTGHLVGHRPPGRAFGLRPAPGAQPLRNSRLTKYDRRNLFGSDSKP